MLTAATLTVTVALCGDGGFLFTSQELATAVHLQLDLIAIVFNDNAYGALKLYQDRVQGGDCKDIFR